MIWRYPIQNSHRTLWKSNPKPSECDTVLVKRWATGSCRVITDSIVIRSVRHDRLCSTCAPILEVWLQISIWRDVNLTEALRVCFSPPSFIVLRQWWKPLQDCYVAFMGAISQQMQATRTPEMSVTYYRSSRRHTPQECNLKRVIIQYKPKSAPFLN